MELLFIAAFIIFALWLFSFRMPRTPMIFIIVILAVIALGYLFGIGVNLANADDKTCKKFAELVCKDVLKTYESNSYNNIAIIQRAGVLVTVYNKLDCPRDLIPNCIMDELFEEKSK